jgi:hypothetical protein
LRRATGARRRASRLTPVRISFDHLVSASDERSEKDSHAGYGKQWIETLKAAIEVIPNPFEAPLGALNRGPKWRFLTVQHFSFVKG